MSLAAIYNVPGNRQQLAEWSFANAAMHQDIVRLIFENFGQQLDQFVLDPFDPADSEQLETWAYQHYTMHQQMDAVLGIQGYDLLDVDFSNPGTLAGWIASHAIEHVQAGQILGLG